jgi:hypothetical protein
VEDAGFGEMLGYRGLKWAKCCCGRIFDGLIGSMWVNGQRPRVRFSTRNMPAGDNLCPRPRVRIVAHTLARRVRYPHPWVKLPSLHDTLTPPFPSSCALLR